MHTAALLGAAHAVADATTGFAIGSLLYNGSLATAGVIVVVYNIIAFGLQPLAGLLVDRRQSYVATTTMSIVVMALGLLVGLMNAFAGLLVIAIGSAFFHVAAGALSARATPQKAIGPGIFTAPGVVGLAAGFFAGIASWPVLPVLVITMLSIAFLTRRIATPSQIITTKNKPTRAVIFALVILLVVVLLRSSTWTTVGSAYFDATALLWLGVAAGTGKLLGSYLADYFGFFPVALLSLVLAFFIFSVETAYSSVFFGVAALQMSTPIFLAIIVGHTTKRPATAAGLVLGLTIALGAAYAAITILGDKPGTIEFMYLGVPCVVAALIGFGLLRHRT